MMLVCPECLEGKFSWVVEQVQFGAVYELENGGYTEETWKNGDIVGDDIADNGVFCCRCMEARAHEELVPANGATDDAAVGAE
ncbi:hypothetical protein DVK00_18660 [Haloarcula sp. Atlit-47R]|uniref:hypothetical protein n=1 Tax=Haloarcula sp. Atlit-47R TaxID=2282132 RepID=UPI000EF1B927|nr:hypothetical protein [Haloarcula sp. Atlit-47R]RLM42069.1 hypothetical protein DVK00_18660 [Haloarcula sp. Atlit-47R]